jgi:16S rRNA (cytidine1402-2'-O)-methyltransferase
MGTLFVVATPIGNLADMTPRAIEVLKSVDVIAAEDTRHSGKLLQAFGIDTPMISYHHHNRAGREHALLQRLSCGDVALISDAGTPAISDPGHDLVGAVVDAGHRVIPVPGASALVAAVSASGLVPGPFVFLGFLPRVGEERRVLLGKALGTTWPVVLFESPQRAAGTLREIDGIAPGRAAIVARELTKMHEEILRGSVRELAEESEKATPRGEVVVVIGEATGVDPDSNAETAERLVRSILTSGVKPSKAAREAAAILGIESGEAYDIVRRVGGEARGTGSG